MEDTTVTEIEQPIVDDVQEVETGPEIDPEIRQAVLRSLKAEDIDSIDDGVKDSWLGSKKHEDLKKLPSWNKHLQRFLPQVKQQFQEEERQRQQIDAQWSSVDTQFRTLEESGQLAAALQNPRNYELYGQLQGWRAQKSGQVHFDPITAARNTALNLYGLLQQDPDFQDFNFEEFAGSAQDPAQVIYALAEHKAKAKTKVVQSKAKAEANDFVARAIEGSDQPDRNGSIGYRAENKSFDQLEADFLDGIPGAEVAYKAARKKRGLV